MEPEVKRWVRVGVAVTLAVPQLVVGVWAVAMPLVAAAVFRWDEER